MLLEKLLKLENFMSEDPKFEYFHSSSKVPNEVEKIMATSIVNNRPSSMRIFELIIELPKIKLANISFFSIWIFQLHVRTPY